MLLRVSDQTKLFCHDFCTLRFPLQKICNQRSNGCHGKKRRGKVEITALYIAPTNFKKTLVFNILFATEFFINFSDLLLQLLLMLETSIIQSEEYQVGKYFCNIVFYLYKKILLLFLKQ